MELYNDPNYPNDKTIVFNVLKTKDPNFARQLKSSREYANMTAATISPITAAFGAITSPIKTYVESKSRARATNSVRSVGVGGKTRRNRRSLKQRKRKHSRRRR